jgi:hypothetical protein
VLCAHVRGHLARPGIATTDAAGGMTRTYYDDMNSVAQTLQNLMG